MRNSLRCGAKTRSGTPCKSPAVSGKKRCRMHGGAKGSGAPLGNQNALKHGMFTKETKELAELFFKIRDDFDITILLIEHDMKFVNHLCDRVMVLDYGKTIFEGHIKDAIKDEEVIKAYLGDFKHA